MLVGGICVAQFAQSKTYSIPKSYSDRVAMGSRYDMVRIAVKFDPDVDDTSDSNRGSFTDWTIEPQPKDINIAIEWYEKAAQFGDDPAKLALGRLYFKQKDYKNAFYWLETQGGKKSYFTYTLTSERKFDPYGSVGWMYQRGLGTIKDYEKAIENYEEIPNASDDRVYFLKAEQKGINVNVDTLKIQAEQGDLNAMRLLAIWYQYYSIEDYQGFENDIKLLRQARHWYKKLEEITQDPEVQYFIANTIPYKERKAIVEKFQWLKKSADNGYPYAQLAVAGAFTFGNGTIQDKDQAIKYGKLACESGLASGCDFYNNRKTNILLK